MNTRANNSHQTEDPFIRDYAKSILKANQNLGITEDELYAAFMEVAQKSVLNNAVNKDTTSIFTFLARKQKEGAVHYEEIDGKKTGKLVMSFHVDTDGTLNDNPLIQWQNKGQHKYTPPKNFTLENQLSDEPIIFTKNPKKRAKEKADLFNSIRTREASDIARIYSDYITYNTSLGKIPYTANDSDDNDRLKGLAIAMQAFEKYVVFVPATSEHAEMLITRQNAAASHDKQDVHEILAFAEYPSDKQHYHYPRASDVTFRSWPTTEFKHEEKVNLFAAVFTHEIMHSLGIKHVSENEYSEPTLATLKKLEGFGITLMGHSANSSGDSQFRNGPFTPPASKKFEGKLPLLDDFIMQYAMSNISGNAEPTLPQKQPIRLATDITIRKKTGNPEYIYNPISEIENTTLKNLNFSGEEVNASYRNGNYTVTVFSPLTLDQYSKVENINITVPETQAGRIFYSTNVPKNIDGSPLNVNITNTDKKTPSDVTFRLNTELADGQKVIVKTDSTRDKYLYSFSYSLPFHTDNIELTYDLDLSQNTKDLLLHIQSKNTITGETSISQVSLKDYFQPEGSAFRQSSIMMANKNNLEEEFYFTKEDINNIEEIKNIFTKRNMNYDPEISKNFKPKAVKTR